MKKKTYLYYLGLALRERRELLRVEKEALAQRYSQVGFANAHGMSRRYYGDIERGIGNVSIKTFYRIAKALETTPASLLARAEQLITESNSLLDD